MLPERSHNSAMIMAAPGSRSEGLRTRVFPVTAAIGIVHSGIILREMNSEALNGTILLTQES